ncbi:MAG: hypothetical protein KH135_01610 [Firmicutes bacterium]|nr:hypothetical protein [Bacillota bacterium]
MRKIRKRDYTTLIIFSCVGVLSIMGIGYSYLQESLQMNIHVSKKSQPVTASEIAYKEQPAAVYGMNSMGENQLSLSKQHFVFQGMDPNNYVSLDGVEFRIVRIENYQANNDTTKVMLVSTSPFTGMYPYLQLKDALKENLGNFGMSSYLLEESYMTGMIPTGLKLTGKQLLSNIGETSELLKQGTLSPVDYLRASSSSNCQIDLATEENPKTWQELSEHCDENNYMIAYKSGGTLIHDGNKQYYRVNGELVSKEETSNIYPVIVLSNHVKYMGEGTKSDPYVVITGK